MWYDVLVAVGAFGGCLAIGALVACLFGEHHQEDGENIYHI